MQKKSIPNDPENHHSYFQPPIIRDREAPPILEGIEESSIPNTSSSNSSSTRSTVALPPPPQGKSQERCDLQLSARNGISRFSYIKAIAEAILETPNKEILLNDLYAQIINKYPELRTKRVDWQNGIRHNLSLNECFVKLGRNPTGKGHYWGISDANLEHFEKRDFRRRWLQSRYSQKSKRNQRNRHVGHSIVVDGGGNYFQTSVESSVPPKLPSTYYSHSRQPFLSIGDGSQLSSSTYNTLHNYNNWTLRDMNTQGKRMNSVPGIIHEPIYDHLPALPPNNPMNMGDGSTFSFNVNDYHHQHHLQYHNQYQHRNGMHNQQMMINNVEQPFSIFANPFLVNPLTTHEGAFYHQFESERQQGGALGATSLSEVARALTHEVQRRPSILQNGNNSFNNSIMKPQATLMTAEQAPSTLFTLRSKSRIQTYYD